MTVDTDRILYERDEPIAYVTLNRPERHNALTFDMVEGLSSALRDADADDRIRTIIVTGAGDDAFCSGGDLEDTMPEMDSNRERGENDIMFKHTNITTPIIAAVNGYCVAAGMEFLQVTDIRIAEESASFGLPEPRWGLSPMGGSHVRLPRQIPYCRAMEFLLTGEIFSAEHALDAGLINEIVPDGEAVDRAEEIAATIARNSPHSVRKIKETVLDCFESPLGSAFEKEDEHSRDVLEHPHADEGMTAFKEDRDPEYVIDLDTGAGESE